MIDRVGVTNLADDDIIAEAGFGQRLHVGRREWLALLNADEGLRGLGPQRFAVLLLHRIAHERPSQKSDRAADGCAFRGVVTGGISNQCPRAGAECATDQRAIGRAIWLSVGRIATC